MASEHIERFNRINDFLIDTDTNNRFGIRIILGTLARIVHDALPNWGVFTEEDIRSPAEEIRAELETLLVLARQSYATEWGSARDPAFAWNGAIIEATEKSGLTDVYESLNRVIAQVVAVIIRSRRLKNRKIDMQC